MSDSSPLPSIKAEASVLGGVNWAEVFLPHQPFLEIIVRGSVMYLALFALLRIVLKREASGLSVTDLLVVVLIADAAQNAMAGKYDSIPDGVLLVATIVFWSFALNWLGYHLPFFERFVHPPPMPLVRDGTLLRRNMRKELITEGELLSQLREQGVADVSQVSLACIEGDGTISVVTHEQKSSRSAKKKRLS